MIGLTDLESQRMEEYPPYPLPSEMQSNSTTSLQQTQAPIYPNIISTVATGTNSEMTPLTRVLNLGQQLLFAVDVISSLLVFQAAV